MPCRRPLVHAALLCGLSALLAACGTLGASTGMETAVTMGEPPRADGPIPAEFSAFVEGLWPQARSQGVSRATFDEAFRGIGPDQDVLEKARYQPEFRKEIWEYLDSAASDTRVANGRAMLATHAALLDRIEATYGVPRRYVLAVWGMESSYGAILGNPKVVKNTVRALATLAWAGGSRAKFGRQQLFAVLRILEHGDIDARHITGSWAGAMGHTQFIPTTYLAYAVDFDGDGRRNIWTSIPDALGSTAAYLRKAGWRPGEGWGYEVAIPSSVAAAAGGRKTLAQWSALGVRRADGSEFPRPGDQARLWLPAGADGPAFLLLHNFSVIKRYNNADSYALGIGHLGDRIAGGGPIVGRWPRLYEPLNDAEKMELQTLLAARGYAVGEIDGKIGSGTIEAIRAYQAASGLAQDGWASQALLKHLRSGG